MDKNKISRIVNGVLEGLEHRTHEIFFEEDDVLRIVVVSNTFIGVGLMKRLDTLTQLFNKVSAEELFDYQLIFNPLTDNEKEYGVSETEEKSGSSAQNLGKKIAKSDGQVYVFVDALFKWQFDAQANGPSACFLRAQVAGFHDAGAAAGNNGEAGFAEQAGDFDGGFILGMPLFDASGTKDGDGGANVGQSVESFHEFAHNAEDAPGIGLGERKYTSRVDTGADEKLLVFSWFALAGGPV